MDSRFKLESSVESDAGLSLKLDVEMNEGDPNKYTTWTAIVRWSEDRFGNAIELQKEALSWESAIDLAFVDIFDPIGDHLQDLKDSFDEAYEALRLLSYKGY